MTTKTRPRQLAPINRAQIDYTLRECLGNKYGPEQESVLYCMAREIGAFGGERAGKSLVLAHYMAARYWCDNLFWICGDDYSATEPEFHYLADALTQLGLAPDVHWHDTDMSTIRYVIDGRECLIKTRSMLKYLKLASEAPGIIAMVEAGRCSHTQYRRLRDRTMEKRGVLLAGGTIETLGWWPEMYERGQMPGGEMQSFSIPSWANLFVYPGGRNDPEILRAEREHSKEHFLQHFAAVPSPPRGLVFPEFRTIVHVREIEIEDAPIELWIDPGYAGAFAVEAVQVIGDQIRVVDEVYERGIIAEDIIDIVRNKSWWNLVTGGVVDIAARQHQAMPAVVEVWQKLAGLRLVSNKVEDEGGRERMHSFLKPHPITGEPNLIIDEKCRGLISEFGGCPSPVEENVIGEKVFAPYKWREDAQGNIVGKAPEDKNNHAIKACTYGIVHKFGYVKRNNGSVGRRVMSSAFAGG